ncbi:basement membrane-specific heparan sulfate proteoglycan core protein-like isoform X3 [Trematomus bernacchii]|uniref:basement membrane-specific heparan sulfate proteoglycan core protein-like isoform X3 n=1 Tax=Trematomus bernacchii TaxID=40690 RepID=UPI00146E18DC|nr:basement membrane-specific heparan sulfate proteoglycan core protein-like isoform X3 [Trematomus bernacchii]
MSLPAAARGFVVFLLVVQVVQGLDDWGVTYSSTEICAVKGSTVEIRCSYTYPSTWRGSVNTVEKTLWFTKWKGGKPVDLTTESEYSGRVEDLCENNICTLRIRKLRESDSAQYKFRIITNQAVYASEPVTLSVTGLQVKVSNIYRYTGYIWANLECLSSCPPTSRPSYIWYKNGLKSPKQGDSFNDYFYPKESYACAVKGYENSPSPSVCVNGQDCNTVAYSERSICAPKGSSVDISCTHSSYEYNVQSKFWFSPERSHQWKNPSQPEDLSEDTQYAGHAQILETWRGRSTLRISDLRDSDSAQYLFKFKTQNFEWRSDLPGTTLTVTALQVQVIRATVQQSNTYAELKCHSSCSPAGVSYVWFKNREKIPKTTRSSYKDWFQHRDMISCALEGHEVFPSPAVYAPRLPYLSRPSGEIEEGSSVTLTCSSDANPAANYTWYKKNGNPNVPLLSERPQLVFRSIQASDSGEYFCTAENKLGRTSANISIDVKYAPRITSLSRPSGEIKEGSPVTLTCSSDANPAAKYTWYKRNGNANVPLLSERPQLLFSSIQSSDSGQYYCTVENKLGRRTSLNTFIDVKYAPKLPSVSVSPSAEIEEGSSVTLTCSSDANPAANYTWYKRNINAGLPPLSDKPQLVFRSIQSSDSGQYYCTAENKLRGKTSKDISIDVKYAPKTSSVSASPSAEIEIGKSLQLTCKGGANPAATHTWYKDNHTLPWGSKDIYQLASITLEDKGNYHCELKNKYGQLNSTSVHIDVQYAPKLPSVSVSPSAEIEEGSSVTLTCSSDANPAANYTWYKKDEDSPRASGQIFTITDFRAEHSGSYSCEAQNKLGRSNSTLHLIVVAGGSMKTVAAGSITAVIVCIIFLIAFLLIRRKRSSKPTTEAGERPDNDAQVRIYDSPSAAVQSATPEQEAEVCYASVRFIKNQEEALYSNIKPAHLRRHKKDEKDKEDDVDHSTVTSKSHSATAESERHEAAEDPSALYSVVNKKPRVLT